MTRRSVMIFGTAAVTALAGPLLSTTAIAAASPVSAVPHQAPRQLTASHYQVRQILNGKKLRHKFVPVGSAKPRSEPLADPDDITVLGHHLYTAFQDGVGPQGEPSPDGNTYSTIVESPPAAR